MCLFFIVVLIYLNDDFDGGTTQFFRTDKDENDEDKDEGDEEHGFMW